MIHPKSVLLLLFSSIAVGVTGQCPDKYAECPSRRVFDVTDLDEYYSSANRLSGDSLKAELNSIIRDHNRYSYNCVWTALAETDADEEKADSVIGIYTRRSIERLDRVCVGNDTGDAWNREHVWAKSHGFPNEGQHAYTDIHHLLPADSSVNNDRGNDDFKLGGTPNDECVGCIKGDGTFEPPDAVKGQIARIMFYMDTRYEGNDESRTGTPDLKLVDKATDVGESKFGFLSDLLEWHCKFPVTERERRRNNIVQTWQGNRNPFIDRPEFVKSIWNGPEFDNIWRSCEGTPEPEPEAPEPEVPDDPVATNGAVWINEFHYDDARNDNDEFVEIGCNNEVDVTGYKIVLYNGRNGISYNTAILSGVCSSAFGDNFVVQAYSPQNGIQNGGPDGIALVDASDAVIEFISYEGSFTANDGPAEGQTSVDIGVSENSSTSEGFSLQLVGGGCERSDFTFNNQLSRPKAV